MARRQTAPLIGRKPSCLSPIGSAIAQIMRHQNKIAKLGQRKSDSASMAFIEWVDAAKVAEEKSAEEKKPKRKEVAPAPKQKEPAAKREEAAPKEKEPAGPTPTEEPKPKKRRWFGRQSGEGEK